MIRNTKDHAAGFVGERLSALRRYRSVTQSSLAGDCLSRNMLSQIERGASLPSYATVYYLSQKLRVDPSYFFEGGPSLEDVIEREALLAARAHLSEGNYALCLMDAQSISSPSDLELCLILSQAAYKLAEDAFSRADLAEAARLYAKADDLASRLPFLTVIPRRARFYLNLIARLSGKDADASPSPFTLPSDDPRFSDELQFAFLNSLIDRGQIEDAMRIYAHTNIKDAFFRSHFNARIAASMNNYDRAKALLFEIVASPADIPRPYIFKAYEDLERYCKATDDYEGAYRCAVEKEKFRFSPA